MKQLIKKTIDLCRSIYFCVRYLPWDQAKCLPVRVMGSVHYAIKGQVVLDFDPRKEVVCLHGAGSPALQSFPSGTLYVAAGGRIVFKGHCFISEGFSFRVDEGGEIVIGKNVYINKNIFIRSNDSVSIGDDCTLGWNVTMNTTNGHRLFVGEEARPISDKIIIGQHVWIGQGCTIGQSVTIANHCVVAQCAVVTKPLEKEHCLYGGVPARLLKEDVKWMHQ